MRKLIKNNFVYYILLLRAIDKFITELIPHIPTLNVKYQHNIIVKVDK